MADTGSGGGGRGLDWGDGREQRQPPQKDAARSPELWRSDEGHAARRGPATATDAALWRPDEGAVARPQRDDLEASSPSDLWMKEDAIDARSGSAERPGSHPPNGLRRRRTRRGSTEAGEPGPARRRWRRRLIAFVLVAGFVAVAVEVAFVTLGLRDDLSAIREDLSATVDLIRESETAAARTRLESARDRSQHASSLTQRRSFVLARSLPRVDAEIGALAALVDAADEATLGGVAALDALDALDVGDDGVAPSLYSDGRLELSAISASQPHLARATAHLGSARSAIATAPESDVGLIRDALSAARGQIADAYETVTNSEILLGLLPDLLGDGEDRRYLLAFQALGEARGTGGLIGTYGVVSASDGAIELEHVGPYTELTPTPTVEGPKWFERAYGSLSALKQPQQVNLTPHFPTAAEVFLRMYEAKTRDAADGVIALDPVALEYMLDSIGPIKAKGLDTTVTSENAAEVLLYQSYADIKNRAAQDAYLARLVGEVWKRIEAGDFEDESFVGGVGEAARTGHLKMYSRVPEEQDDLVALEAAGDFASAGDNVQLVFVNNYGVNKLDYFLERDLDTKIEVATDLSLTVTTEVVLTNAAPDDVDSGLLGPDGTPENVSQVAVLMPKDSKYVEWSVNGRTNTEFTYSDSGYPVVWDLVWIPAGEQATVEVTYRVPPTDADHLNFTLFPQTAVAPSHYSLQVVAPSGYAVAERAGGLAVEIVDLDGILVEQHTVGFTLVEKK